MPATSRKQQRFMGMVHATQKGEISAPSAEVAEVAKDIDPSSAEEFASTSHEGLPLKKESVEDEGNPKKRKGNFRKEMLEGAPMVGTMMGMPIGGAAGSVLGLGGAAAGLGLASKSKVLRDLANRHPQLASGLLAAGMLGAAPAGMVGGGLLGHYLGRQATKLGAFFDSKPKDGLTSGDVGGLLGGTAGGILGGDLAAGGVQHLLREPETISFRGTPRFSPDMLGLNGAAHKPGLLGKLLQRAKGVGQKGLFHARKFKTPLSVLGWIAGMLPGAALGSMGGRSMGNFGGLKTSSISEAIEKKAIEQEEILGGAAGGVGGAGLGGSGTFNFMRKNVPGWLARAQDTVDPEWTQLGDMASDAATWGMGNTGRPGSFANTADDLGALLRHLARDRGVNKGLGNIMRTLGHARNARGTLMGLIGAGAAGGGYIGGSIGKGLGGGLSELRKMITKPAAAKQAAREDVLKLAAVLPPIMRKAISTVGRPKAAMVGLLSLLGSGGLSKRSHAKRASAVVQPQTKEAAIKTATAHWRNMQTFFEKTATLADLPTVDNFANYLDCVVRLNPQLGVLTKVSTQLRMHKPVPAAFRDAYPAMDKTSRAKVASRLVMTYLETRRQVSDTINELEHPHV